LLVGLLLSTQTPPLKNTVFANLNLFGTNKASKYAPIKSNIQQETFITQKNIEFIPDANGYTSIKVNKDFSVFVNINDTVIPDKTFVKNHGLISENSNSSFNGKYQIVLGCFSIKENASRLVKTLSSQGINAAVTGVNNKGLNIVSVGGFKDIDSARALLQQVRQKQPTAWLMIR